MVRGLTKLKEWEVYAKALEEGTLVDIEREADRRLLTRKSSRDGFRSPNAASSVDARNVTSAGGRHASVDRDRSPTLLARTPSDLQKQASIQLLRERVDARKRVEETSPRRANNGALGSGRNMSSQVVDEDDGSSPQRPVSVSRVTSLEERKRVEQSARLRRTYGPGGSAHELKTREKDSRRSM
jgi:hypothetical protein